MPLYSLRRFPARQPISPSAFSSLVSRLSRQLPSFRQASPKLRSSSSAERLSIRRSP